MSRLWVQPNASARPPPTAHCRRACGSARPCCSDRRTVRAPGALATTPWRGAASRPWRTPDSYSGHPACAVCRRPCPGCHYRSETKERAMGSSSDDEDQDQQPSNFGPLALFGFMFWSMTGSSHGAEPTARPRLRSGGEIKPLPAPTPMALKPPTPVASLRDSGQTRQIARSTQDRQRRAAAGASDWRRMPDVPPEVESLLLDPGEWAAFPGMSRRFSAAPAGRTGALPANFTPALNADELAGVNEALRAGNEALRREFGLEATPGLPAGAGAHVDNAGSRVRRSGSASSVGGDAAAASLPRSAVRAGVDERVERLAMRCVEL